jgi:hypothetical protein
MRRVDAESDLVEFAFESQAVHHCPLDAARLARQSWSSNVRAGLTGELRLRDGRYSQVVEGPCAEVLTLAARILADPRHASIRILALRALPARRHAAWVVSGFDLGVTQPPPRPSAANYSFPPAGRLAGLAAS